MKKVLILIFLFSAGVFAQTEEIEYSEVDEKVFVCEWKSEQVCYRIFRTREVQCSYQPKYVCIEKKTDDEK